MRTFNVDVRGSVHVIRAHGILRPTETANGKWCFTNQAGQVVWTYPVGDVRGVAETVACEEEVSLYEARGKEKLR
jgi:hypothetical protein